MENKGGGSATKSLRRQTNSNVSSNSGGGGGGGGADENSSPPSTMTTTTGGAGGGTPANGGGGGGGGGASTPSNQRKQSQWGTPPGSPMRGGGGTTTVATNNGGGGGGGRSSGALTPHRGNTTPNNATAGGGGSRAVVGGGGVSSPSPFPDRGGTTLNNNGGLGQGGGTSPTSTGRKRRSVAAAGGGTELAREVAGGGGGGAQHHGIAMSPSADHLSMMQPVRKGTGDSTNTFSSAEKTRNRRHTLAVSDEATEEIMMSPSHFDMSDSLFKRRGGMGWNADRNWILRWFTLKGSILCYYDSSDRDDADPSRPRGRINLNKEETLVDMHLSNKAGAQTQFLLTINLYGIGGKRKWEMCCRSKSQQQEWFNALRKFDGKPTEGDDPYHMALEFVDSLGNKVDALGNKKDADGGGTGRRGTISGLPSPAKGGKKKRVKSDNTVEYHETSPFRLQRKSSIGSAGEISDGERGEMIDGRVATRGGSPATTGATGIGGDDRVGVHGRSSGKSMVRRKRKRGSVMEVVADFLDGTINTRVLVSMVVLNYASYLMRTGSMNVFWIALIVANMLVIRPHMFTNRDSSTRGGHGRGGHYPGGSVGGSRRGNAVGAALSPDFSLEDDEEEEEDHEVPFESIQPVGNSIPRATPKKESLVKIIEAQGMETAEAIRACQAATKEDYEPTPHSFWNVTASAFQLRTGPNYKRNKQKAPSGPALYNLYCADFLKARSKLDHASDGFKIPDIKGITDIDTGHTDVPPMFVVNVNIPQEEPGLLRCDDGPSFVCVLYLVISERLLSELKDLDSASPAVKLFVQWCQRAGSDSSFRGRFKAMCVLDDVESLGLPGFVVGYNGKPTLINKSGTFTRHDKFIEMSINVHMFAYIAKKSLYSLQSKFPAFILNVGLTIEGRKDDELPEALLGGARFIHIDVNKAASPSGIDSYGSDS